MITMRRAAARLHLKRGDAHVWSSVPAGGFGELLELEDEFLPPQTRLLARSVAETVLYLCNGTIADEFPTPESPGALLAGSFQRVAGAAYESRLNASTNDWARVFRIRLRPVRSDDDHDHDEDDRAWFSAAERRGRLRLVASSECDDGALWIPQDVLIYSALLDPGQHVVCELEDDRSAWVHVVRGSATVLGKILETSDSAEVRGVRAVGVTAREVSEVLILDLTAPPPLSGRTLVH